jgi:hypothetical protein
MQTNRVHSSPRCSDADGDSSVQSSDSLEIPFSTAKSHQNDMFECSFTSAAPFSVVSRRNVGIPRTSAMLEPVDINLQLHADKSKSNIRSIEEESLIKVKVQVGVQPL